MVIVSKRLVGWAGVWWVLASLRALSFFFGFLGWIYPFSFPFLFSFLPSIHISLAFSDTRIKEEISNQTRKQDKKPRIQASMHIQIHIHTYTGKEATRQIYTDSERASERLPRTLRSCNVYYQFKPNFNLNSNNSIKFKSLVTAIGHITQ